MSQIKQLPKGYRLGTEPLLPPQSPIAVGDHVVVRVETDTGKGVFGDFLWVKVQKVSADLMDVEVVRGPILSFIQEGDWLQVRSKDALHHWRGALPDTKCNALGQTR